MATRFKPTDHYEVAEGNEYRLLPFNFTRLVDDKYVVTNLVGEHLLLERPALEDLVKLRLARSSRYFSDLKAKHFLIDIDSNVGIELLALKWRTKIERLSNFTSLHIFVVTLRCEHSCPYCQVSRKNDGSLSHDMSLETADIALNLAFKSPSPYLKIEFQGGESLLAFDRIKYIVERAQLINESEGKALQFVIATNLAMVDEGVFSFCQKHDILISTSLDGPEDLHNANRPRPGKNSYEKAVQGISAAIKHLGKDRVSALMTTTLASLSKVKDIIDEYVAQGMEGIFLRPLSPYGFAVKTRFYDAYDEKDWLDFYFEGLDYIIKMNKDGHRFIEFYASMILSKILTPYSTGYVDLMNPAGIGVAVAVYNYDGDVYASDEGRMLAEMRDHSFRLGNVHVNSYEDIFLSENLLRPLEESFSGSVPMCNECAFEPFCGAEPVFHHATQGDAVGHKPTSKFCNRNMAIFRRLISLLEDKPTREIFMSWITT